MNRFCPIQIFSRKFLEFLCSVQDTLQPLLQLSFASVIFKIYNKDKLRNCIYQLALSSNCYICFYKDQQVSLVLNINLAIKQVKVANVSAYFIDVKVATKLFFIRTGSKAIRMSILKVYVQAALALARVTKQYVYVCFESFRDKQNILFCNSREYQDFQHVYIQNRHFLSPLNLYV